MILRQSQLFTKTTKENPKDEVSTNARLLMRAGFVSKVMAGVYSYLPLGLRVMEKIKTIVREEMNSLGAQEILMPALHPKENYEKTKRWDAIDVLFKIDGANNKELALGSTHEEIVTPLVQQYVKSYKDLPLAVYQIQDKFRNEARAKSGLLRGREFSMKDLYSFHKTAEDFEEFYKKAAQAYHRVFERCGMNAKYTAADGGVFSKFSHEFQVVTPHGEDIVFSCGNCDLHTNKEIVSADETCETCSEPLESTKAIEVGNIFPLKTKFSSAFDFTYTDADGKEQDILMGCYGIGISRVMGAIVEVHADEQGMVWPAAVAPADVHVVPVGDSEAVMKKANEIAITLSDHGKDVLFDDRDERPGAKFADSDLIGIPVRIVVSERLLEQNAVEVKERTAAEPTIVSEAEFYSQWGM